MINIIFAENLKLLMKEHALTQLDLSYMTGIAQSTISSWLNGRMDPILTNLWILADLFDYTIDELVGRKEF